MLGECLNLALKCAVDRLKSFPSLAAGVGHNPDPIPAMSGANVGSGYAMPFRVIPERGQGPENVSKSAIKERCHVFQDNEARSQLANDADHLEEQPGTLACQTLPHDVRDADVLAGEASADGVNGNSVCCQALGGEGSDVIVARHLGPVFRQHAAAVRFDFAEGDRAEAARSLQAKAEAANTGKQIQ